MVSLRETIDSFVDIGLGYLSLDRASGTLSGGEAQRTKMIRHLGSALTDISYVFDEPTAGLHPHDIQRMNELLSCCATRATPCSSSSTSPRSSRSPTTSSTSGRARARAAARSSTRAMSRACAPRARSPAATSTTGRGSRTSARSPKGALEIRGATQHNLKNVDVDIPLGILTVVTGVAGSGKSSLIHGNVPPFDDVVVVDQAPIKGSRRSSPATYTGILDAIRAAFAKANGVKPALFSANSEGACPACRGLGVIITTSAFTRPSRRCASVRGHGLQRRGARVPARRQEHRRGARDVGGRGTRRSSRRGRPHTTLLRMIDVGLGYITLGQALNTLSGGERQRLKLAISMAKKGAIYVLDEPTTGLHLADVDNMLGMLDRLVDAGNCVIVIEHHQAVMAHADWIIDLGPGAGHDGGEIVFEGTPADLVTRRRR